MEVQLTFGSLNGVERIAFTVAAALLFVPLRQFFVRRPGKPIKSALRQYQLLL